MRVLIWHGWLLEGSGSNVFAARLAEELRSAGHDVLLVCQERHAGRYRWIDASGSIGSKGAPRLASGTGSVGPGRCTLLRPDIGDLLPVFVFDEYEGFDVKRFVDLSSSELDAYLARNVAALRGAAAWHGSEVVIAQHAIPGAAIAARALGSGRFLSRIAGSDLEYAIRLQPRYLELAREGLEAARAVAGSSSEVLQRCAELVPGIRSRVLPVPPGVEVSRFRPLDRGMALAQAIRRLGHDPDTVRGRPRSLDGSVRAALSARDAATLDGLARSYDQAVPDPDAADRLRALAEWCDHHSDASIVGYFGKLIPQKGAELLLAGAALSRHGPAVLVVGFGLYREWLTALDIAVRERDVEALDWLRVEHGMPIEGVHSGGRLPATPSTFTGRLDHRYAPGVLAAMDVLVVPSILDEAFGMVAAEGAAAGALPLVARHSGLAEVAAALEAAVGRPGLFSFTPGPGADGRIAEGIDRILELPRDERHTLRREVSAFVAREWTWSRAAERLLEAAQG